MRAALDLVAEVSQLGGEAGVPGLAARAGVVTGEVAVTLGAVGEGMVAGDAVNTAARVQSAAEPGSVLVDGVTQRLAGSAIGFVAAGSHRLKGKAGAVELWRAIRVLRELSTPYHLAHGLFDYAQYLMRQGDTEAASAAIEEARGIAGRLRCQPLLDRAAGLTPTEPRIPA